MTYAEHTRAMPTIRRKAAKRVAAVLAAPRETLKLGCTTCGSRFHGRLACPMSIDDGKGGVS